MGPETGRDASSGVRPDWATIPNGITLIRLILLVPAGWLIAAEHFGWPLLVLVALWAYTDWIDGWLARRFGWQSRTGEILDPVADRLGIAVVATALAWAGLVPWPVVLIVVIVDLLVVVLAGRAAASGALTVSLAGKARSFVLFTGLVTAVAAGGFEPAWLLPGAHALLWTGAALHIIAGVLYIVAARRSTGQASGSL
ncbi:CDP-alcohol phosphatidyltransferase family protein [Sediminivirga luteola]|jgi:cardiolipin synthase|uniref:Phosphatidylglycerophosphate synthase n=1 Tax=Sediminivirga luteola TaxID=1774748 RepID=A0A8J2U082_9MICO|nr:CDP-alcohol phosphatidyltransferase family protein [Sediminivirga luteola]GGA23932.1 phosphatidylglycerophosphate synthase [Sediminivirga luteola]